MTIQDKFFVLLRLSVDDSYTVTVDLSGDEWIQMYGMAKKQSLVALCFRGISRLPLEKRPDEKLFDDWLIDCHLNYEANKKAYSCLASLQKWFRDRGFRSCVLKGQGNARMYPDAYIRTTGDIDLWVEGGTKNVLDLVRKYCPDTEVCYHHAQFINYKDIPVEVHYRPSFLNNMINNYRMQRYFRSQENRQFENFVDLPDCIGAVCMPTDDFNRIFQLGHIYRHLMQNGIGLRQIIDYYYLLRRGFTAKERDRDVVLLKSMGLYRIAEAVMYVEQLVLGMEDKYLIVPANEKAGRLLLNEIIKGGNFGHYDERVGQKAFASKPVKNIQRLYRNFRLFSSFEGECLWEPVFRIYHFFWRKMV